MKFLVPIVHYNTRSNECKKYSLHRRCVRIWWWYTLASYTLRCLVIWFTVLGEQHLHFFVVMLTEKVSLKYLYFPHTNYHEIIIHATSCVWRDKIALSFTTLQQITTVNNMNIVFFVKFTIFHEYLQESLTF